jgi:hypothetical protein
MQEYGIMKRLIFPFITELPRRDRIIYTRSVDPMHHACGRSRGYGRGGMAVIRTVTSSLTVNTPSVMVLVAGKLFFKFD